ncbi:MAG: acyl-CoA desaturase [Cyclobacteriaceae bacterium]|nr:acyl-CoA desaturase [Cyclobacteriaceae bacterium]
MTTPITFSNRLSEFHAALNQRVNAYFKTHNLNRGANAAMWWKTLCMLALFLVPYGIMVSGWPGSFASLLFLFAIMGLGTAGIGLSIMHDANHGAYSRLPWVNQALGMTLNLVGGNAFNWKIQHNVLHHTYTNVFDMDEDISPRGALRMAPESPWKSFHRYQHFYAWFLYTLMTLVWVLGKDFVRLVKYQREGLVQKQKADSRVEWVVLAATKLAYFTLVIIIPVIVLPFTVWQVLAGFLIMHFIAGFILAVIFQPAHVVDGTSYFQPDENGTLENSWAVHQLHTTTNFAMNNWLLNWFAGGLNFQIEHHLFPNVCHVHYPQLAPIVRATAEEFGVPYKVKPTFWAALVAHRQMLLHLGARP